MPIRVDDRVSVKIKGELYKGYVCFVREGFIAVDLDNGMLTDWFKKEDVKRLRKVKKCKK